MAKKNSAVDDDGTTAAETVATTDDATVERAATEAVPEPAPAATATGSAAIIDGDSEAPYSEDPLLEKDPGKTLGVIAVIVSLVVGIVGFVLGLVSYRRARAAGFGGGTGMIAMVLGAVTTVVLASYLVLVASGMGIGGACDGRQPGVYTLDNGTTISCR